MRKLRLWLFVETTKARLKNSMGLKLSPWEDFMIETWLY